MIDGKDETLSPCGILYWDRGSCVGIGDRVIRLHILRVCVLCGNVLLESVSVCGVWGVITAVWVSVSFVCFAAGADSN